MRRRRPSVGAVAELSALMQRIADGRNGDVITLVLEAGTVRIPLRLVGYDRRRYEIVFAMTGVYEPDESSTEHDQPGGAGAHG